MIETIKIALGILIVGVIVVILTGALIIVIDTMLNLDIGKIIAQKIKERLERGNE